MVLRTLPFPEPDRLVRVGAVTGIRGVLVQVEPAEPLVYLAVSLVLALVVLAATSVPARRAATVDPVEASRCE